MGIKSKHFLCVPLGCVSYTIACYILLSFSPNLFILLQCQIYDVNLRTKIGQFCVNSIAIFSYLEIDEKFISSFSLALIINPQCIIRSNEIWFQRYQNTEIIRGKTAVWTSKKELGEQNEWYRWRKLLNWKSMWFIWGNAFNVCQYN